MKTFADLKKKIIEINPSIVTNEHAQLIHMDHSVEYFVQTREVRLSEILLVFNDDLAVVGNGCFLEYEHGRGWINKDNICWNLRQDNLMMQSDEVKKFLINLLK